MDRGFSLGPHPPDWDTQNIQRLRTGRSGTDDHRQPGVPTGVSRQRETKKREIKLEKLKISRKSDLFSYRVGLYRNLNMNFLFPVDVRGVSVSRSSFF